MESARIDERGRLKYHGMLAGYRDRDGDMIVDAAFFCPELSRYLFSQGLRVTWRDGVADQLETQDVTARSVPWQRVRVHQLGPEADPAIKFRGYAELLARFGPPRPELYRAIFDGLCPEAGPDRICDWLSCRLFGRDLAVSDVLELCGGDSSRFYYVDTVGLRPIPFTPNYSTEGDVAK